MDGNIMMMMMMMGMYVHTLCVLIERVYIFNNHIIMCYFLSSHFSNVCMGTKLKTYRFEMYLSIFPGINMNYNFSNYRTPCTPSSPPSNDKIMNNI